MVKKIQQQEPEVNRGPSVTLVKGKTTLRLSSGVTRSGQLVVRATLTMPDGKTKQKSREFVPDTKQQNALYMSWQQKAERSGFTPKGSPVVPFDNLLS